MWESYSQTAKEKMENNVSAFRSRLRKIRTGRAHPALLESVTVLYYGSQTPLSQMANITSPSPRSLVVNPWDEKALKEIEQALARANLGINPQNDGKVIRLNLPELTEERRKELVKEVKKEGEKCRVDLRNNRRGIMEEVKKAVKDKKLSEDDQKQVSDEIQKLTDHFVEQVEKTIQAKEKEIMEI
ncbi:MAG: ribosome recycling factor [Oligoflexia bacterium]|nr:ribosome recycling factor [Oligoflexia bacterium]